MRRPALFLDRDGVINIDHGHVHSADRFDFIDGVDALCRRFQATGYRIVVVTNQAGIGRGLYTEAQFLALTEWMMRRLADAGVTIDRVYFCPFHPEHGIGDYQRDSFDRKPHPGMLLRARDELGLDLRRSVLVGDKLTDIEAALRAGIGRPIFFTSGDTQMVGVPIGVAVASSLAAIDP